MTDALRYRDLDEFYDGPHDDELGTLRRQSPEVDYGVMWRVDGRPWPAARVSWVEATGELYAYVWERRDDVGAVEVLGVVPDRGTAERVMAGWADSSHDLEWVRMMVLGWPAVGEEADARRRSARDAWALRRAEIRAGRPS